MRKPVQHTANNFKSAVNKLINQVSGKSYRFAIPTTGAEISFNATIDRGGKFSSVAYTSGDVVGNGYGDHVQIDLTTLVMGGLRRPIANVEGTTIGFCSPAQQNGQLLINGQLGVTTMSGVRQMSMQLDNYTVAQGEVSILSGAEITLVKIL